jgi:hypothetical protein
LISFIAFGFAALIAAFVSSAAGPTVIEDLAKVIVERPTASGGFLLWL